jgi:hypothetical protein
MEFWKALWILVFKIPLALASAALAVFWRNLVVLPNALATMLRSDWASCVSFFPWIRDSIAHNSQWIDSQTYWVYAWWSLCINWQNRYWALFPFRFLWHFLLVNMNLMLWPLSVFYPTVMEVQWTRVILLLIHIWLPAYFDHPGEIEDTEMDEEKNEDTEAKEPTKKVFKGMRVRSSGEANGMVNSVPLPALF